MCSERGEGLIESLLALGLVALVVALAVQVFAYVHARSVAAVAAQDGARAAIAGSAEVGLARADAILAAAGGTGAGLSASAVQAAERVTITVRGQAPRVFPVSVLLPAISTSASLPVERYPAAEARS
jgi:hypothetical protein